MTGTPLLHFPEIDRTAIRSRLDMIGSPRTSRSLQPGIVSHGRLVSSAMEPPGDFPTARQPIAFSLSMGTVGVFSAPYPVGMSHLRPLRPFNLRVSSLITCTQRRDTSGTGYGVYHVLENYEEGRMGFGRSLP